MIQIIVILGLVLNLYGTYLYVSDMFKGTTKPNRVSAFLWMTEGLIAVLAAISAGVTWAVVPSIIGFLGPFITLVFSYILKQSYWALGPFDWICGALSVLSLFLWWKTGNPNIAIVFAILADAAAGLPTVIKSWKFPQTETAAAYGFAAIGYSTTYFALKDYSFAEIAFPLYGALFCAFTWALIASGPYRMRKKAQGVADC